MLVFEIMILFAGVILCWSQTYLIPGSLDWCMYWRQLGEIKPECSGVVTNPPTTTPVALPKCTVAPPSFCTTNYECLSRSACVEDGHLCCAPLVLADAVCPSIQQLGIECKTINPTNWCNIKDDCHTTPKQLCCPTGCNYNICVQGGHPIITQDPNVRDLLCPLPETVAIKCPVSPQIKTNWCDSQDVCNSLKNSALHRRCCPTLCGYNACMLNYNGKWIIA